MPKIWGGRVIEAIAAASGRARGALDCARELRGACQFGTCARAQQVQPQLL
jgi:hypothetical protein